MKKSAKHGFFYAQIAVCDWLAELFPNNVNTVPEIKEWLKTAEQTQRGKDQLSLLKKKKIQFFKFRWFG